jgi:hypothetical protein
MNKTTIAVILAIFLLALSVSFVGTLCWFALYEFLRNTCGMSFLGAVTAYSVGVSVLALLAGLTRGLKD